MNGTGKELDERQSGRVPDAGHEKLQKVDKNKKSQRPGWANGLRQLYDSVVEEPLPDNFKDLLAKLDNKN